MITQERLAFDVGICTQRIQGLTKDAAVEVIAKDWSGFAWEYGLKDRLRFTPFPHRYYQVPNCHSREGLRLRGRSDSRSGNPDKNISGSRIRYGMTMMVCEEDLKTGVDFLDRIDRSERDGLIFEQSSALKDKFLAARPGKKFIWASPLGEGFSNYSFLYYGEVKASSEGKVLEVQDFLNDLDRENFNRLFGLDLQTNMRDLINSIAETDLDSTEAVWQKLTDISPTGRIFDKNLKEILSLTNPTLLRKAQLQSKVEAERIYQAIISGMDRNILQDSIEGRLVSFVTEVTGTRFTISQENRQGSCGSISRGSSSVPGWCEYNAITGEFRCKFCKKELKQSEVNKHICICKN